MTTLHAQRTRAVVCATGDSGETGRLSVAMYARACVWRAALPVRDFVSLSWKLSIEGFGVSFVFFSTSTRRPVVPNWQVASTK